jgi:type I restriction enzyme M protein
MRQHYASKDAGEDNHRATVSHKHTPRTGITVQNEWEFQGEVLSWVNDIIASRRLLFDRATGEFPNPAGKRSDVIIWRDRVSEQAVAEMELKKPSTGLGDAKFQSDAIGKAQHAKAPYIVLWNMRKADLYRTPQYPRASFDGEDFVRHLGECRSITSVDKGSAPSGQAELKRLALDIVLAGHDAMTKGSVGGQVIEPTVFVDTLRHKVSALRSSVYKDFASSLGASKTTRNALLNWARKQGILDFVDDVYEALAAQFAYRVTGQVLFYYAFRRQENSLPMLSLSTGSPVVSQLRMYWDRVRGFDYEALYDPSPLETITLSATTEDTVRAIVEDLSMYDWDHIELDVLGSIFEQMIPEPDRVVLGQYYTSPKLADVLLSLCTDTEDDIYLDPGVGTGTFLYRAYDRKSKSGVGSHSTYLDALWGFDISAFPAELSVINLYRQDLSNRTNFPRIAVRDFFDVKPTDSLQFPPARATLGGTDKVNVSLPAFNVLVGNPPYVRSQQLDDLDAAYKHKLQAIGMWAGVQNTAKFDAFAYFIVHAASFLQPGGRMGFVTSAAWLTARYGAPLQKFILDKFADVLILYSEVEPFFQADVDTIVLVGRRVDDTPGQSQDTSRGDVRFVCLTRRLAELLPDPNTFDYWAHVDALTASLETDSSGEYKEGYRISTLDGDQERHALQQVPGEVRNWGRELKRSPIYNAIFE